MENSVANKTEHLFSLLNAPMSSKGRARYFTDYFKGYSIKVFYCFCAWHRVSRGSVRILETIGTEAKSIS